MANLNRVLLIGNLTRDVELRYTPRGVAVAEISLAINRVTKDESGERREETTFVDVTLWSRQAEIAQQYLRKGSPLYLEGRLQLDTWEDKQTGQKRSRLKVVAENMQLLGAKREGAEAAPSIAAAPRPPGPPRPAVSTPVRNQPAARAPLPEPDLDVDAPF